MKTTVSKYDFINAFVKYGGEKKELAELIEKQFTRDALGVLFDYFEEIEESMEEEMELDVIGICCDYMEGDSEEFREMYDIDEDEDVREYLEERTTLLELGDDWFLIKQF